MGAGGKKMNVCVQGLWHLGTVTAACLASLGNVVTGLEFDSSRVKALNEAIPPILEPGLADLLRRFIDAGTLRFSCSVETAVRDIDILWVTYDTPVDDSDNADAQ